MKNLGCVSHIDHDGLSHPASCLLQQSGRCIPACAPVFRVARSGAYGAGRWQRDRAGNCAGLLFTDNVPVNNVKQAK